MMNKNWPTRLVISIILSIFLFLSIPGKGYGGIIKTKIICRNHIEQSGDIIIESEIINSGTATAYNVSSTIFIGDWAEQFDNLGDNRPAGRIRFKSRYIQPDLLPGKYVAVLRVNFEERSGKPHKTYHFFEISYGPDHVRDYMPLLSVFLRDPLFNPKAFLKTNVKMGLVMKNGYQSAIKPVVTFFSPDGCTAMEHNRFYTLSPDEEKTDEILLAIDKSIRPGSPYDVVVKYNHDGIHYARHFGGKIDVVEQPIYFRWYLVFGIISLLIFFALIYTSRKFYN